MRYRAVKKEFLVSAFFVVRRPGGFVGGEGLGAVWEEWADTKGSGALVSRCSGGQSVRNGQGGQSVRKVAGAGTVFPWPFCPVLLARPVTGPPRPKRLGPASPWPASLPPLRQASQWPLASNSRATMSGQAGIEQAAAAGDAAPTAFGFVLPGSAGGDGQVAAPGGGQATHDQAFVVVDVTRAGQFPPPDGAAAEAVVGKSPAPGGAAAEPVGAVGPVHATLGAIPAAKAAAPAKPQAAPGQSPLTEGQGQEAPPQLQGPVVVPPPSQAAAAPPNAPPGQWQVAPAPGGSAWDKVFPAASAAAAAFESLSAAADIGSRGPPGSRTRSKSRGPGGGGGQFASARGSLPSGQSAAARQAAEAAEAPMSRLTAPGSAAWVSRLGQAGAPTGQPVGWSEFEASVQQAALSVQAVPVWPGPSIEADASTSLVMPRSVWNLRDHLGQLSREIHTLDGLLLASWFGQFDAPPLRRAMVTAIGNLLPFVQANRRNFVVFPIFSLCRLAQLMTSFGPSVRT